MRKLLNIFKLLVAFCLFGTWARAQLTASFSANATTGCAPQYIQFTDNSTGSPDRWEWDLGNGTTSVEKNPSVTYLNPGAFSIKLTIYKGAESATVTRSGYIQVHPNPVVAFDVDRNNGCIPVAVKFTDKTTTATGSIKSWKWDFGDGNLSSVQSPAHTYRTSGNFSVTLTAENSHGCIKSLSLPQVVKVNDSIRANFTVGLPGTCGVPYTVSFNDKSVGANINSWQWDFGDGSQGSGRNTSHTYTTAGQFSVRLIVGNSSGCSDTIFRQNAVSAGGLLADFTMSKSPACLNERVILSATTSAAAPDSIIWMFSDGTRSRGSTASKRFTTVGTVPIIMTVYSGGCTKTITKTIEINPGPVPAFTADVRAACAPPLTVNFTNQTNNGNVVGWQFGGDLWQTGENPSYTFVHPGNYRVSLIVESANGCRDTLTEETYIKIAPPTITAVAGLPLQGCAPISGTFTPSITTIEPVTEYLWDFGDGTTSAEPVAQKTYDNIGTYTLKLQVKTASGCVANFEEEIKAGVKPKAAFSAEPLVVCPQDEVSFTSNSTGQIDKVQWMFGDGGQSSDINPVYFYQDTGFMDVTLIVTNNGCSDTLMREQYVYVNPPIARFKDSFSCASKFQRIFVDESIGATSWQWEFGDGSTFAGKTPPSKTYGDTGIYNVKLTVSDGICTHSSSRKVSILERSPELIFIDTAFCDETRFSLALKEGTYDPGKAEKFEWFFEGFGYRDSQEPVVYAKYTFEGDFRIKLTIIDNEGCNTEIWKSFHVQFLKPKAVIKPDFMAACAGTTLEFPDSSIVSPLNPIIGYVWDFGEGADTTFTRGPFTHTYNNAGYYNVSLQLIDSAGCGSIASVPEAVAIYKPSAKFFATDTLVCPNTPIDLTNESSGIDLTYQWNFGNGTTSTNAFPTIAYPDTGRYTVSLNVTDTAGCTASITRPLYLAVYTVDASFIASDSFTSCPPLEVGFTNTSTYASGFTWDFGNGNGSLLMDPSHTYTAPGTFTAKLKATGIGGCVDSAIQIINIQGPMGDIKYTPLSGCAPVTVDFKSSAVNTVRYTWDFSDGNSSSVPDPVARKTYELPGKYVPRLILEDGKGCRLPVQGLDTIHVLGVKAYTASLNNYQFCDSAIISFSDSSFSTDNPVTYFWNFGDGRKSADPNPVHQYNSPGRYTVTLTVSGATGCVSTDTLNGEILISPSPIIQAGADTAICLPGSIFLLSQWMNPDTSGLVYQWALDNSIISNDANPSPVSFNRPGRYEIGVTGVNSFGCSAKDFFTVVVNDTPKVVAQPNAIACLGSSLTLEGTGAATYIWDSHPTLSCTNCATPQAKPSTPTIYRVTGTDDNGCISSDTVLVKVQMPFRLQSGPGDTICAGESVDLFVQGADRYTWTPANTLTTGIGAVTRARPTQTTTYTVVGRDSANCFSDSASIRVVVYPIPQFDITESSLTLPTGSSVVLQTTSSPDINSWRWSPALGLSCVSCAEPVASVRQEITYTAEVRNAGGCRSSDRITIIPTCSSENIFIPNTFSPNADGRNDIFYPRGKGIAGIKSLRIFSRWGEIMYERKDFAVNDPTAGWDGTYQGKLLTPDVYVYVMQVLCDNNTIFDVKGNVTLLR